MTLIEAGSGRVSPHMDNIAKPRAVIYARVSVDDFGKGRKSKEEMATAASQSIESQLSAARKLVKSKKYTLIAEPFVDDGVSGYKGKRRTGFDALQSAMIRDDVDVVVTRAMDRIGRNDEENSGIRHAAVKHKVKFHLLNGTVTDPGQSSGKLSMQIEQGISEYQSAVKSETLRNVYAGMRASGRLRSTRKVFGWQWQKGDPKVSMKADDDERMVIRKAYRDLLRTDKPSTLYGIIQRWNEDPKVQPVGKAERWSYASVRAVLLRPSNAGLIRDPDGGWLTGSDDDGKPLRGQWDTLVPEFWYSALRAKLTAPSRRTNPGRKSSHLVSGIVRCGVCGDVLRSSTVAGRNKEGERVGVYRCVRKLAFVSDEKVRHVSARILDLDKAVRAEVVKAFLFGSSNLFPETEPDDSEELHAKIDAVYNRRSELSRGIAEGLLKLAGVRGELQALNAEEEALRGRLNALDAEGARVSLLRDLRKGLWAGQVSFGKVSKHGHEIGKRFDALDITEKRALVRHLLDVTVLPVAPGRRGSARWDIQHKVVTSLQDDDEFATEA